MRHNLYFYAQQNNQEISQETLQKIANYKAWLKKNDSAFDADRQENDSFAELPTDKTPLLEAVLGKHKTLLLTKGKNVQTPKQEHDLGYYLQHLAQGQGVLLKTMFSLHIEVLLLFPARHPKTNEVRVQLIANAYLEGVSQIEGWRDEARFVDDVKNQLVNCQLADVFDRYWCETKKHKDNQKKFKKASLSIAQP